MVLVIWFVLAFSYAMARNYGTNAFQQLALAAFIVALFLSLRDQLV